MMRVISRVIAAWPQVAKRSLAQWRLLSSVVIGVVLAAAIMSGTVIYFDALRELALKNTLSKLSIQETNILIKADRGPTTVAEYDKVRNVMNNEINARVGWFLRDRVVGGKSATFFMTEPGNEAAAGGDNSRAYFNFLPDLMQHIEVLPGGSLPREEALSAPGEPLRMEALIPIETARQLDLEVGDAMSIVPFWRDAIPHGTIVISGIFQRNEPDAEYWQLDDTVLKSSISDNFRAIPYYISEKMYMEVLGTAFRDMDSTYGMLLAVDTDRINASNSTAARLQIQAMKQRLSSTLFSYRQLTVLDAALTDYDLRLFFSKVPMFIILVLISIVILYYVVTLSSLLVEQQRGEIALLRSRGASSAQVLAVFVLEGATVCLLAVVVAPLVAAVVISGLGFTPAFAPLSGGAVLTVNVSRNAYLMGALGGLLSFAALLIPAVQASRIGVTRHRQQSARPTNAPFFQRFYLDIALLIISVLLFRQLSQQGSVVAVSLFGETAINQVLLAVPALILLASAMTMLRLFPLAIRFLSGDSMELVRLLAYITVAVLAIGLTASNILGFESWLWLAGVALLLALGIAFWATERATTQLLTAGGIAAQALFVALIFYFEIQLPFQNVALPLLATIPVSQVVFVVLKRVVVKSPVGVSMGLWQMSRNPTHYARLSLLLILMAGLGIFAASFGGTLERNFQERALYATGGEIRINGLLLNNQGQSRPILESYEALEGVDKVSPVIRASGADLSMLLGDTYTMISMDPEVISEIGWFRDDFSDAPRDVLLGSLRHPSPPEGLAIPEDSSRLGVRFRADRPHPTIALSARIRDANGRYFTYLMGMLVEPGWKELEINLARTNLSRWTSQLQPSLPLSLVSLSVYELDGRSRLRAGSISVDEIYVTDSTGGRVTLETFDTLNNWNILRVTPQSKSDGFQASTVKYNGNANGATFIWTEGTALTSRGIFHGPPTTPIPALASASFIRNTVHDVGDEFEVSVRGHRVNVGIVGTVDYFPTADTFNEMFLLTDYDSLQRYGNLDATSSELTPNEIWISTTADPVQRAALVELLSSDVPFTHREVIDRMEVLAASQVDPLVAAGWRSLLFIAFGAVLTLSCLGFLVHAYVSFRNREMEFALMRTIGFSLRQLTTLVWLEQVLVIAAGLGLGTWMGGRLGEIIIPFLAHDDRGSQVLPPFVLEVNWVTLGLTYGVMVVVFALIIAVMITFIRRISLQRVLRLGEM